MTSKYCVDLYANCRDHSRHIRELIYLLFNWVTNEFTADIRRSFNAVQCIKVFPMPESIAWNLIETSCKLAHKVIRCESKTDKNRVENPSSRAKLNLERLVMSWCMQVLSSLTEQDKKKTDKMEQ
ncbi:CLUMA_CG001411, isoform A [Clunio marinus]|uniref:CLUMA_CG001411, isoform A n=1 Tax=Clunio marinus TaxID=568069 RepID=A0A1J1HHV4_9DIPT|nr:CLUMA_CG001411, isoform A [Clunio marinus]